MSLLKYALSADKLAIIKGELGVDAEPYLRAILEAEQAFFAGRDAEKYAWLQTRTALCTRLGDKQLAALPSYAAGMDHGQARGVSIVTPESLEAAIEDISRQRVIGFDTETAVSFEKGQANPKPISLIQVATPGRCYLFRMLQENIPLFQSGLTRILSDELNILKVGIGLSGDYRAMSRDFGICVAPRLDLNWAMHQLGAAKQMGTVQILASLLKRHLPKRRKITLSNWAKPLTQALSPGQIDYAAADAFAAQDCFFAFIDVIKPHRDRLPRGLQQRFEAFL